MGTGKSIPTFHHNVEPFTYPTMAKRINEYILQDNNHWNEYTEIKKGSLTFIEGPEFTNYAKNVRDLWFKNHLGITDEKALLDSTINYMKRFMNEYLNQWWAQTRLEASYGYLQLVYMTAVDPKSKIFYNKDRDITKGTPPGDFDRPEDLNYHVLLLPLYNKFTINNLKNALNGNTGEWGYKWTDGFEGTWKKALKIYNKNEKYGIEVIGWSLNFLPISSEEGQNETTAFNMH
jgi:hypothetical protein